MYEKDLKALSDEELRDELLKYLDDVPPVLPSSRSILEKRLMKFIGGSARSDISQSEVYEDEPSNANSFSTDSSFRSANFEEPDTSNLTHRRPRFSPEKSSPSRQETPRKSSSVSFVIYSIIMVIFIVLCYFIYLNIEELKLNPVPKID